MITYSIEILYHFNCSECKKWWSIGDFDIRSAIACPFCGHAPGEFSQMKDPAVNDVID